MHGNIEGTKISTQANSPSWARSFWRPSIRKTKEKQEKWKERARLAQEKKRKLEEKIPPPPKKNIGKIEKVSQKRGKSKQKPNPHPPKKIQGCRMLLGGALYIFMCQAWWTIRFDIDAWVDCKFCGDRFHIRCTNLPVPDDLGDHLIIPAIFVP